MRGAKRRRGAATRVQHIAACNGETILGILHFAAIRLWTRLARVAYFKSNASISARSL
jgi:hypothetical protein